MKQITTLLVLIFTCALVYGQTQFQRISGTKNGERNYHLASTKAGHLIATGYTNDVSGNRNDAFLIKFNRLGKVQWSKTYGDVGDDYSWDVNVLDNNDILGCGYSSSFGTTYNAATLTRLDSNGNVIWLSALYTSQYGIDFYQTHETSTGHILATGLMQTANDKDDIILTKFTPKGYFLWAKTVGTSGSDEIMGMTETSTGHYLLAGLANDGNGFGSSDFAVVKTDTAGRIVWSNIYGGTDSERLNAVVEANGDYYFSGWSKSVGQGDNDIVLMKTDTAGKLDWVNAYGSNRSELCFNMHYEIGSNSIIMAGYTDKFSKTGQTDNRNSLLLKVNADNGNLKWSESYGGNNRDGHWPTGLAVNGNDMGYYVLSSTNTFATGDYDLYLVKTDTSGNGGCNQRKADLKVNTVKSWSANSFGSVKKPTVVWAKATISGSKWSLTESTECCELYVNSGLSDTLCPGDSIFIGSRRIKGYNYSWFKGATKVGNTSYLNVKGGEGDDYILTVNANAPGCSAETDRVSVVDDAKPKTQASTIRFCKGDTAVFRLMGDFSSNNWFSTRDKAIVDTGIFLQWFKNDTILWQAQSNYGCRHSDTVFTNLVEFPEIQLNDSASYCAGDSVYIDAKANYSYKWTMNNQMDTGIWVNKNRYYVVESYNNQCVVKDSIWVHSLEYPMINLVDSVSSCEGDSIFVSLTSTHSYKWKNTNINNGGRWLDTDGYFNVISTNEQCQTIDSVYSRVNSNPNPDLGTVFDTCYNTTKCFFFEPTYDQTYWNGSRTSRDTFCALPSGEITVMVVDENTCLGNDTVELRALNSYVDLIESDTIRFPSPEIQVEVDNGDWQTYLWTGKNVINNENSRRVLVFADGWYTVVVTDANGCTEKDSVYAMFEASIYDNEKFAVNIYPNPANEQVIIKSNLEVEKVLLYSLSGQLLVTTKTSNIDVSQLKAGVYFIEIVVDDVQIRRQLVISR